MKQSDNSNLEASPTSKSESDKIAVDGFNQVLELLRVADSAFRQSLLRRLSAKDPDLAQKLIRELGLN